MDHCRSLEVRLPRDPKPAFKQLGGSNIDAFNQTLADQTLNTLWLGHSDDEQRQKLSLAACAALMGARLRDELEGMLVPLPRISHLASAAADGRQQFC